MFLTPSDRTAILKNHYFIKKKSKPQSWSTGPAVVMTFSWSERQDIYQELKTVRENSIFLNQSKATKQKTMLDCWKYCAWEETADHLSCQLLPLRCTGWIPQSLEAEEGILGVSSLEHWAVSRQTGKQSRSLPRQSCSPEGWGHRVPLSVGQMEGNDNLASGRHEGLFV